MDKLKKIEETVLCVLNAHALQVSSLYATVENPNCTDAFIRDVDGKFRKIANEIANKIANEN